MMMVWLCRPGISALTQNGIVIPLPASMLPVVESKRKISPGPKPTTDTELAAAGPAMGPSRGIRNVGTAECWHCGVLALRSVGTQECWY